MSVTLLEDAYMVVRIERELGLVVYARTSTPFPDIETARAGFTHIGALDFGHADKLISDVREAPGNNSPEFEKLFEDVARKYLFGRFKRRAVLVKTVVGKMQVERLAKSVAGQTFRTFQDPVEARRWLLEG